MKSPKYVRKLNKAELFCHQGKSKAQVATKMINRLNILIMFMPHHLENILVSHSKTREFSRHRHTIGGVHIPLAENSMGRKLKIGCLNLIWH